MACPDRAVVGVDVGARMVHAVQLAGPDGERPAVRGLTVAAAGAWTDLLAWSAAAAAVAIDAPDAPSTAPHAGDRQLPGKFRTARCAEIAAGQDHGVWVSWATPVATAPIPGWMRTGFGLWEAWRAAGLEPMEIYPAGCVRLLSSGRWPPRKTTAAGRAARLALLADHVDLPGASARWGHDTVDAAVAALVAWWGPQAARGAGHRGPGCDASTLWLPPAGACRRDGAQGGSRAERSRS